MMAHFVAHYDGAEQARIAFAWNGKHAEQFCDHNLSFRRQVLAYCLAHADAVPLALWRDMWTAEAACAKEAWSVIKEFDLLAQHLLINGGEAVLDDFVSGYCASFDTYVACQYMDLPIANLMHLLPAVQHKWQTCTEGLQKNRYEGTLQLLTHLFNRYFKKEIKHANKKIV